MLEANTGLYYYHWYMATEDGSTEYRWRGQCYGTLEELYQDQAEGRKLMIYNGDMMLFEFVIGRAICNRAVIIQSEDCTNIMSEDHFQLIVDSDGCDRHVLAKDLSREMHVYFNDGLGVPSYVDLPTYDLRALGYKPFYEQQLEHSASATKSGLLISDVRVINIRPQYFYTIKSLNKNEKTVTLGDGFITSVEAT